ncbi:protein-tyrosine-phosphatase IBR5-like [Salvia splendens]|uniref:protein-tyrosine-phosphatase IBR5-like n=1 Tax=Salvia splendens TaxID=180675 RepID=UPI001104F8D6|nr:protein-tyrosine-phosphatase IBR5-like [Salvia splendens]
MITGDRKFSACSIDCSIPFSQNPTIPTVKDSRNPTIRNSIEQLVPSMRKRERENPCGICGHYHKYEEGEVCGICGHRIPATVEKSVVHVSAFASQILPDFLFLGSFDNAARCELLKSQGISCILNAVPSCQNLYKNSFTYHRLQYDQKLPFDDAIQFLEQCEKQRARVLVHCMSGKSRSPAIVMAFLMKNKGWKLAQSYQWVKEHRPSVELNPAVHQQLQEFEQIIFGSIENSGVGMPNLSFLSFGFSRPNDTPLAPAAAPVFTNTSSSASIFNRPSLDVPPQEFTFGAGPTPHNSGLNISTNVPAVDDFSMDGS